MKEKATITTSIAFPIDVARGSVFQTENGTLYRVTRRVSDGVVEIEPLRWWHKVPWKVWLVLGWVLGAVVGQVIWHLL